MKRNPRKLKWTKAYRKAAGKEMTVDSTLQFTARRNVPQRYDRELTATTLRAMERISQIRARRERAFYKRRMAGRKERELGLARKLVAENEHLLPRLRGSEKKRLAALAEEQGVEVEELEKLALEEQKKSKKPNKVFGEEKKRLRVRVDGGVEEIGEAMGGIVGVGGLDEDDFDDEEDDGEDDDDMDVE